MFPFPAAMMMQGLGGGAAILKPQDVHATTLYTGNGGTQGITNGLNFVTSGGTVRVKNRGDTTSHVLVDTVRGAGKRLAFDLTGGQTDNASGFRTVSSFDTAGFSVENNSSTNGSGVSYVAWADLQAPKYLQIRTFTHTSGTADTFDMSALGVIGEVTTKRVSSTGVWSVWHRSLTPGYNLQLNSTNAQDNTNTWISVSGTTVTFSGDAPSGTYYLEAWAHDTGVDGLVQCGATGDQGANSNVTVALPWRPQLVVVKPFTAIGVWSVADSERGFGDGTTRLLSLNNANAEAAAANWLGATASGFSFRTYGTDAGGSNVAHNSIYRAIRAAY